MYAGQESSKAFCIIKYIFVKYFMKYCHEDSLSTT